VGRHLQHRRRHRRRSRLLALRWALGAVVLLGAGAALAGWQAGGGAPTAGTPGRAPDAPAVGVQLADGSSPAALTAPAPVRVRVPAIGVDSPLVPLALDASGALEPPQDTATAGWYAQGPAPGAVGPAVIAGHVDSYRGPGVFLALRQLAPGDPVLVGRADGSTVVFTVTAVDHYAKDAFPTERVYGPTPGAELRLITCGGVFDRSARSYEENVVVSARLTAG
jgi:sortase (surface protein transpeptidase)